MIKRTLHIPKKDFLKSFLFGIYHKGKNMIYLQKLITLEQAYKLPEKGFILTLTKDLLDEPIFIISKKD